MTRARLRAEDGFTIIEAIVVAVIMVIGMFSLLAAQDAFRAKTSQNVVLEAATHEAQQELEYLRSLGYKDLVLSASPGASTGYGDPREGMNGLQFRPGTDTSYAPLVIDATAESPLAPSRSWSAGDASGTVYRFITQEPAGTTGCGQICPKRVTVGATYQFAGALHSVVLTTLVADPQQATADEITPPTTKPAQCPCWSTLFLYDTPATFADRQTPSTDHILHARNDHPDLMDETAPPNPYVNNTSAPFEPTRYRYGTDLEASDGLGMTYPGGALIKPSGGCNDDADKKKTARWTSRPVLENTVVTGNFTADLYTKLAGTLTGKGILCFTFYDWTIDSGGKIGSKTKLLSAGWTENPYPSGTDPDEVKTGVMRFLNTGTTRTITAGRSLGVEITIDDHSAGSAVLYYDHPALSSSVQVESSPTF
jgi:type II secretory pathway pseudopilin PulG